MDAACSFDRVFNKTPWLITGFEHASERCIASTAESHSPQWPCAGCQLRRDLVTFIHSLPEPEQNKLVIQWLLAGEPWASIDHYCAAMSQPATWADEAAMRLATRCFGLHIVTVTNQGVLRHLPMEVQDKISLVAAAPHPRTVFLHIQQLGPDSCHFEPLFPTTCTFQQASRGFYVPPTCDLHLATVAMLEAVQQQEGSLQLVHQLDAAVRRHEPQSKVALVPKLSLETITGSCSPRISARHGPFAQHSASFRCACSGRAGCCM